LFMIKKHIPAGKGHLKQAGRRKRPALGRSQAVDVKQPAFFVNLQKLVHLG
jgi:hypothetical protein